MSDKIFSVNEIFSSIDGEGIRTGYLTTFIRLNGCNLKCSYCDTKYAQKPEKPNYSIDEQMQIFDIMLKEKKYEINELLLELVTKSVLIFIPISVLFKLVIL